MSKDFKLNIKMFFLLTVVYLSVGLIGGLIFRYFDSVDYFPEYYIIVLFYWATGMILNFSMSHLSKKKPESLVNIYLMGRMIKFLLTIIFLFVVEVIFTVVPRVAFALSLMGNYIIYSTLELYIYFRYNKIISQKENEKKK